MSKQKHKSRVMELFDKSPVVDYGSIKRIVQDKGSKQYHKQLIKSLLDRGEIKRLAKGYYTKRDNPSLLVFCFKPAYLGLQNSISEHDLWEQETIPIVITGRKVRQGIRKVLGQNVLVKRIKQEYIFGFDYYKEDQFYLPYSDIEKTFIDMIYFNENISGEVLENIKSKIDNEKLENYLDKYPDRFKNRIFNLLKG